MKRTTKQIVYGSFYAVLWILIFYGLYRVAIRPAPSCVDTIRNRDEVDVDCGGQYCISCEVKRLLPIQFSQLKQLTTPDGLHTSIVVEIRNPNAGYGTEQFSFRIGLYGTSSQPLAAFDDVLSVYPGEVKYRLIVNAPFLPGSVSAITATSTRPINWRPITEFAKPKMPMRDVKTLYGADSGRAVITGIVKNDNPFAVTQATINAIVATRDGAIVAVSKTAVRDLIASEERFFQIIVPLPASAQQSELVDAKVFVDVQR